MKTITIANTSIPIKFGMYVLGTFLREMISNEISPPEDESQKNVVAKEESSHLNTSNAFVSEF
jgi:hypothetical protein